MTFFPFQVAEITFNFWYRLSEELYQKNVDLITEIFKPYIQRLIVALCHHCQMDSDHVSYIPNFMIVIKATTITLICNILDGLQSYFGL